MLLTRGSKCYYTLLLYRPELMNYVKKTKTLPLKCVKHKNRALIATREDSVQVGHPPSLNQSLLCAPRIT